MTRSDDRSNLTRRQLLAGSAGAAALNTGAVLLGSAASAGAETAEDPRTAVLRMMQDPAGAVSSGEAWIRFCDSLKPLARHVTGPESLGNLQIQTEGLRCLSRLVALGLDRFVEHGDPRHPDFYDLQTPTRKYLGDNPDQTYRGAAVEGSGSYRIRGNARGAAGVEVGVYAGSFRSDDAKAGGGGGRRLVDSRDESTLEIDADGGFEIRLSPDAPDDGSEPNHLALAPDANAVLIRTYFWDRGQRRAHAFPTIERLDVSGPAPPVDPASLLRGLFATTAFVDGSLEWWNAFPGIRTQPNELIVMPDDGAVQTPSLVRYINGIVELGPDEALVLELDPEDEPGYWSWVLQNVWGETPDWRDRPIVLNNRDLFRRSDGSVKIVVSHRNPGVPNWMDMSGHPRLLISLRWRGAAPLPEVKTRTTTLRALSG